MTPLTLFTYRGELVRVIDGDTVELQIDLGFSTTIRSTFRLVGLNCPEMHTPAGPTAKSFTEMWFTTDRACIVQTVRDKREKYGRYLARVYDETGRCLNEDLLTNKLAVPYLE